MAATLWNRADAAAAIGAAAEGAATRGAASDAPWQATGISIDTRSLKKGDLFLALPGAKIDGHAFLAAAHDSGAAAALVTEAGLAAHPAPPGLPLLIVPAAITSAGLPAFPDPATNPDDADFQALLVSPVFIALWKLAHAARTRSKAGIIAVTGSVGKTSAKEALMLAIPGLYDPAKVRVKTSRTEVQGYATQGNLNNHLGVPLTLAALPPQAGFAVIEMGMNHAGEITPLSKLARPHLALITNVEAVHAEFFASVEDIARAKAEIFAGVPQEKEVSSDGKKPAGRVVIPRDSAYFTVLHAAARNHFLPQILHGDKESDYIVTYGRHAESDFRLHGVPTCGVAGTKFSAEVLGHYDPDETGARYDIGIKAVGEHWVDAMLGVAACLSAVGSHTEKALHRLKDFQELQGRGRVVAARVAGVFVTLIDDSYNASPVSMRGAIEKLGLLARGEGRRSVAVLGEMLELGAGGPDAHRALAELLIAEKIDLVFLCGALMRGLADEMPQLVWAESAEALRPSVEAALQEGDFLLVKGSHGSRVHRLAQAWQPAAPPLETEKDMAHAV